MSSKLKKSLDSNIKQSLFSDTERFEMFFSVYWKKIAIGAALLIAIVCVISLGFELHKKHDKKIVNSINEAATQEELAKVIKENPNHPAIIPAKIHLAAMYNYEKKYDQAILMLDEVIKSNSEIFAPEAGLMKAYILECANKKNEAIKQFSALFNDTKNKLELRCEAGYATARLQAQTNNTKEALETIKKVNTLSVKNNKIGQMYQSFCKNIESNIIAGIYSKK